MKALPYLPYGHIMALAPIDVWFRLWRAGGGYSMALLAAPDFCARLLARGDRAHPAGALALLVLDS